MTLGTNINIRSLLIIERYGHDATGFVNWLCDLIKYLEGETTWRKWKLTIDVSRNAIGIRNGTLVRDDLPSHRCLLPRRSLTEHQDFFNSILRNASTCQSWLESNLRIRTFGDVENTRKVFDA